MSGEPVPVRSTMISMSVELYDGRSVEVASIGREGAVGGIVSCGHAPAFSSADVLVGGPAFGCRSRRSKTPKGVRPSSEHFLPLLGLSARAGDAVGRLQCFPFDPAARRALAAPCAGPRRRPDRADPGGFAGLLGVQRTTVNAVVRSLQDEGLVATSRGVVRVTDRAGLKRRACECYQQLEDHFGAVIGTSGNGGSTGC